MANFKLIEVAGDEPFATLTLTKNETYFLATLFTKVSSSDITISDALWYVIRDYELTSKKLDEQPCLDMTGWDENI